MTSRIIRISDAPLPTPDPWAGDEPGAYRCPTCATLDPGESRCRRCGKALTVKTARRKPLTANMANLCVVLIGRGPMLLAIGFLYRAPDTPLLNPWIIWLVAQMPLFWLCAAGMVMRWRWGWYLAFALSLIDLLAEVGFQLVLGGSPVLPIAAVLTNLMILGFLLTVFDELRVEWLRIGLPEEANLPRTGVAAYNAGVEYSRAGHWYFAARMWQRAAAVEHHEGRYRRALGLAYMRLKELDAATAELAAAHQLMPDDQQTRNLQQTLAQLRGGEGVRG